MLVYKNLRRNETGIYLGGSADSGPPEAHHYRGDQHLMVIGGTRVGKDARIITPILAQCRRSIFVVDPEGQQAAITARARAAFSKIVVINPFGTFVKTHLHLKSVGFNPLRWLDARSGTFVDDCMKLARSLVEINPHDPQPYFANSAIALLAALIIWAILTKGEKATLPMVRDMLCDAIGEDANGKPIGLSKTVADIIAWAETHPLGRAARNKISDFQNITRGLRDVRGSARTATDFLDSALIREDMTKDGFDFRKMKGELVTVYVINPHLDQHSTWLRVFMTCVMEAMLESPPSPSMPRPLLLFNETHQARHLELLLTAHGRSAKWFQILTCWHDIEQLDRNYNKALGTFEGACGALLSFAPKDWPTAEHLSKRCGQYGEVVMSRNLKPEDPTGSSSENVQSFPLLRPEDLMRFGPGQTLNFIEAVPYPIIAIAHPYWELDFCQHLDEDPFHPKKPPGKGTTGRAHLDQLVKRRSKA